MRARGRQPIAIDLFAGCGGLTAGLRAAGFRVVAAVEKDPDAAESYVANHPDVFLLDEDIRKVDPQALWDALELPEKQRLDLIAGCPPCQGFTRLTENSRRRDRRNGLVRDYLRFVEVLRPRACMLENVPGLARTRKGRRYFNELLSGLRDLGYLVTHKVVELADYGVPQFRKRLVLLACEDTELPIPGPTHGNPAAEPCRQRWRTVADAIDFLPEPPSRRAVRRGEARPRYSWHYSRDVAPLVTQRLRHALSSGQGRSTLPAFLQLECHKRRPDGYYDVYGAMDWCLPSPTITSGCTNASKGRFGHPGSPRPLTAREAALLQTFPVTYKFKGSGLESVAAQIGNALPRRFAKVIAKAIVTHLRQSGSESSRTNAASGRSSTRSSAR
jgi:DNA (cytosine-5)-methyltransferase 1